jgi:hypothetical protein
MQNLSYYNKDVYSALHTISKLYGRHMKPNKNKTRMIY